MDQTREKLQCAVCGWEWWKRLGSPDPKRCARPDCRSMRWKGNAGEPTPPDGPADPAAECSRVEEFPAEPERELRYEPIEEC
jgi:hypothetical protein